jgi:hypothetical protein
MKISIPSFLSSVAFLGFLWLSGTLFFTSISKFSNLFELSWNLIGIIILSLIFPTLLTFLFIKLKVVYIKDNKIQAFYPFRLKIKSIQLSQIKKMNWRLLGNYKTGDYRMLELTDFNGKTLLISDLEFQNFDSLEAEILNKTNCKPNLNNRNRLKLDQAKSNLIFNPILLILMIIISYKEVNKYLDGDDFHTNNIIILSICLLVGLRLVFQAIEYIKRIKTMHNNS